MKTACVVPAPRCGYVGPGVARHHILGRAADGSYVQPEILVAFCQPDCHQAGIHHILSRAGLDGPMEPTPGLLVCRIAANLGWIGQHRTGDVVLFAELLAEIADVLWGVGSELRDAEETVRG